MRDDGKSQRIEIFVCGQGTTRDAVEGEVRLWRAECDSDWTSEVGDSQLAQVMCVLVYDAIEGI